MSDINKMDYKQLRNEVQLLRDELAIMQRKYEDILYNLDDDNFSSTFKREKDGMKTAIKQTEEEISLQAEKITENEETMAELTVKAGEISSIAKTNITAYFESSVAPTKANTSNNQKKMLCLYNNIYYYYNDITEKWEEYPKDGLQTMFVQNGEGFALQGNVLIDGNTVITQNLKLSGNVTWDMSNSPVQTRYSSNGTSWHSPMVSGDMYMQMSFDGGKSWSTSTKVVGTDGRDGYDGSDANVTPQNVFNALTNSGASQGIFAAFVKNQNQIYINAEMIQAGILSGMKLQNIEGTHYLQMSDSSGGVGEYGTFRLYNNHYSSVPYFSIYDDTLGTIGISAAGEPFLEVSASGGATAYPSGTWDFTHCDVIGIEGGGSGGTATAVFG